MKKIKNIVIGLGTLAFLFGVAFSVHAKKTAINFALEDDGGSKVCKPKKNEDCDVHAQYELISCR